MITSSKFDQTTDPKINFKRPKMNKAQKDVYNKMMSSGKGRIVKRGGPAWKGKAGEERDTTNTKTGLAKTNKEIAEEKGEKGSKLPKGKKGLNVMIAIGVPKKGKRLI